MIQFSALLIICTAHFLADFVFQMRWMAVNKSSSLLALLLHIVQYTVVLALVAWPFLVWSENYFPDGRFGFWIAANAAMHLLVDFVTSQITKFAHDSKRDKLFWATIGVDQLAHQACLFGSYVWLGMQ